MALQSPAELESLSRMMACILRHKAGALNLQMDVDGWCRLRDLHDILKGVSLDSATHLDCSEDELEG